MADESIGREMNVTGIRNGTVIDHIDSDATFKVADLLQVQEAGDMVLVGTNLGSGRLGKKGLIKIENRRLTPDEVSMIALIAPQATLNIISDFEVVEKFRVELPKTIERVVKCFNPRCISNQHPIDSKFEVLETSPPALRCVYCERVMHGKEIMLK